MNKTNKIVLVVILICIMLFSIPTQIMMNNGYNKVGRLVTGVVYIVSHEDYRIERFIPIIFSVVLFILVFTGLSDKDDIWMKWIDKIIPKSRRKI